jgi:hypothetical protein
MTALHLQTPDARTRDLLLRLALALDCTELTDGPLSVACPYCRRAAGWACLDKLGRERKPHGARRVKS